MSDANQPTSVVFTSNRPPSERFPEIDDDDIQITLAAPYIQTYLAYNSRGFACCGVSLPIPFERASRTSWWDPRFDSDILEGQYKRSAFTHLRLRFRYALFYILLGTISWLFYFLYNVFQNSDTIRWPNECLLLTALTAIVVSVLYLTYTNFYRSHVTTTSLFVALLLCALSLLTTSLNNNGLITCVGHFFVCAEILLLIYTVIPLPLYLCATIALSYSVIFEILSIFLFSEYSSPMLFTSHNHQSAASLMRASVIIVRILVQFGVHLIGVHIFIMTNVRMRGTFMKVGQSLLVRRQLEMEKQLKEKMIHSVMPPRVADWLMSETGEFDTESGGGGSFAVPRNSNPGASDLKSLFRPFNMNRMENVSILFADIVGFTKMSSNKTAEELVEILNDLFERFDELCSLNNCEKISTLGDCYYCVSGCPEPCGEHAQCCVEMGLSMIDAIRQFDRERNEGVNMRVGIHTGTVLCGIVGTRRFKFDVWSNDVTLANRMESTGRPGRVHISQTTCDYLHNLYILEDGEPLDGIKTYFIVGRLSDLETNKSHLSVPPIEPGVQLIISPPTSPHSISSPPLLPAAAQSSVGTSPRPRFLSACSSSKPNPNQLSPHFFRVKANSLPSILDSDTEADLENKIPNVDNDSSKSPTSTSSYGKYSARLKNWPKFLFRQELAADKDQTDSDPTKSNGYQQVPTIIETLPLSPGQIVSIEKQLNKNDILDIKSYISQSRSDIGHSPTSFIRSNSFKSNSPNSISVNSPNSIVFNRTNSCGSQPTNKGEQVSPMERDRCATVTSRMETGSKCLEVPASGPPDDQLSVCLSVNSRKDSGIKSTSRRSSIQQQIFALNQAAVSHADMLQHRVSGYYTSSQSTIGSYTAPRLPLSNIFSEHLGACVHKLRKQSDLQLIRCVQDNTSSKRSYFIKPPLSKCTLFFKSRQMELEYRQNVYSQTDDSLPTLATSRYNTYFDVLVSLIIFFIVSTSIITLFPLSTVWLVLFVVFLFAQVCTIFLCFRQMKVDDVKNQTSTSFKLFYMWYTWHVIGAILVSMPVVLILINFKYSNSSAIHKYTNTLAANGLHQNYLYSILILIGLIHFCNFTQLNCWMKNTLAVIYSVIFLVLLYYTSQTCTHANYFIENYRLFVNNSTFRGNLIDFQYLPNVNVSQADKYRKTNTYLINVIDNYRFRNNTDIYDSVQHYHLYDNDLLDLIGKYQLNNFSELTSIIDKNRFNSNIDLISLIDKYQLNNTDLIKIIDTYSFDNIELIAIIDQYRFQNDTNLLKIVENYPFTNADLLNLVNRYRYNLIRIIDRYRFKNNAELFNNVSRYRLNDSEVIRLINESIDKCLIDSRSESLYRSEIYLDIVLLLFLIWFLNREFEISYRLSFHSNIVANRDKIRVQSMKNQADWLLHNIIPKHVADQLKQSAKYSENHKDVGIIFASIVNFNEMYDETYMGGKEFLRVLNELIGDFDELLLRSEFKSVDKIKTIGSTFMAASGLNPQIRRESRDPYAHLYALMDFAMEMQKVIDAFNRDLLEFNLILRVGYNYGDVTAGVIGTTKLYYDIWGDAVNISSRMDTTGVNGRIQVGGACLDVLSQRYEFEPRGSVYVKGKDHMNVYLLVQKKTDFLEID